jgi:uncharacterized protein (TIGR02646 family)
MIRINRRPASAPQNVTDAETKHFLAVSLLAGAFGPLVTRHSDGRVLHAPEIRVKIHQPQSLVDGKLIDGYRVARPDLYEMQHKKCCYCEWQPGMKARDVEHFRPKAIYWWLAWSWPNLLFSCDICNSTKGDYFPLKTNTALQPTNSPPGPEEIWLLDPSDPNAEDPLDHIEFKPIDPAEKRWRPFPRNGSRHGQEIIAAVQLDRIDLLDHYNQHVLKFSSVLVRIERVMTCRDATTILAEWEDICTLWLSAGFEYVALSRDILKHRFKQAIQDYNLDISVRYPAANTSTNAEHVNQSR